jgi:hypothetical protein
MATAYRRLAKMNINENKWIENHTERPMTALTLFNAETDNDEYSDLRMQMVDELTTDQMNQPQGTLMGILEDLVWDMFTKMDDDDLQNMYDTLKEETKNE